MAILELTLFNLKSNNSILEHGWPQTGSPSVHKVYEECQDSDGDSDEIKSIYLRYTRQINGKLLI
jgi:hypothetical protein